MITLQLLVVSLQRPSSIKHLEVVYVLFIHHTMHKLLIGAVCLKARDAVGLQECNNNQVSYLS